MAGVFANPLRDSGDYSEFRRKLLSGRDPVGMTGCMDSEKVHLMSTFLKDRPFQLVVTGSEEKAQEICDDYRLFTDRVWYLPPKDLIFFQADIRNNTIEAARMRALLPVIRKTGGVIVTTVDGLMNAVPPREELEQALFCWKLGEELDLEEISHRLYLYGYERLGKVEEPGQYSIRGGIVDIFPLTEENPVRMELFGDEIDSIRYFDALTQRSGPHLKEILVFPATELVMSDERKAAGRRKIEDAIKRQTAVFRKAQEGEKAGRLESEFALLREELAEETPLSSAESFICYFYPKTSTFLDYFEPEETFVFVDEPVRLKERGEAVELEFAESMKTRLEQGYILPGQAQILSSCRLVLARLARGGTGILAALDGRMEHMTKDVYSLHVQNMNSYKGDFGMLVKDLRQWKKERYRTVYLCPSRTRCRRLVDEFIEQGLNAYYNEEEDKEIARGDIMVTYGNLHRGFLYPLLRFAVVTDGDIFGVNRKKKRTKPSLPGKRITDFGDLALGDYIIHETYGLGIYRGVKTQKVDRVTREYIQIEYGDGGNLYTPVTQLDRIAKYADASAKVPKLNKLGGTEWKRTREKVQKAVAGIAKELVELYAVRQQSSGYAFGEDTEWQKEFEEAFPYEETEDQEKAIREAKADMESRRIMDRLLCGDVGFGKTEVALRCAFKAVQDSKQVAYLAPTTVLAQQVYNTFAQRMADYPVRVELVSRFRTSAQIHRTLEDLKAGKVDIVVGTHRILSKDVVFSDLGLLVVDEEQRFGVTHKEKIKQLKKNVDVLTMTATPIPRTLHMSLVGIRDMSILNEAPADRRPIQTYVMEMNWELVREAIHRELARGGQVYYVYNRVRDIDQVAAGVAALVPEAEVAYAHGQMPERQIEKTMMDFISGDIDVLVSTTIIETGLDIPNVNTIIIHDADRYGLSQLYQLRGRVGRSSRTAYAFILYQKGKILQDVAEKRLRAIREFTDLGSGIRIAMRDLEIRGAGNLLGSEQHGHMQAVGYDLYCKMLSAAVRRETGGEEEGSDFETTVEMPVSAYLPENYVAGETTRIELYKRIAALTAQDEISDLADELTDRFGPLPAQARNLLEITSLKLTAHEAFLDEVKCDGLTAQFYVNPGAGYRTEEIPKLVRRYNGSLRFIQKDRPYFVLSRGTGKLQCPRLTMDHVKNLLYEIKMLIVS